MVALAQAGKVCRSNIATPSVLIISDDTATQIMFMTSPAFTWGGGVLIAVTLSISYYPKYFLLPYTLAMQYLSLLTLVCIILITLNTQNTIASDTLQLP